jgi:hypothetical protein
LTGTPPSGGSPYYKSIKQVSVNMKQVEATRNCPQRPATARNDPQLPATARNYIPAATFQRPATSRSATRNFAERATTFQRPATTRNCPQLHSRLDMTRVQIRATPGKHGRTDRVFWVASAAVYKRFVPYLNRIQRGGRLLYTKRWICLSTTG